MVLKVFSFSNMINNLMSAKIGKIMNLHLFGFFFTRRWNGIVAAARIILFA